MDCDDIMTAAALLALELVNAEGPEVVADDDVSSIDWLTFLWFRAAWLESEFRRAHPKACRFEFVDSTN